MRAAIYNPYLDTLGGGERYTLSFANVLAKNGYDVDLEWKEPGIRETLEERFGMNLGSINIVPDIKKGDGYDLCFWVSDGSIPLMHSRRNILHFQVPFHGVKGKSLINKMKLFRINRIVCNSEFTKNIIDEEFGVKSVIVYPPVDTDAFKPRHKENIILYVGRFSKIMQSKSQDVLISAFKRMFDEDQKTDGEMKSWKLILTGGVEVGVDDKLSELKNLATGYPIEIIQSPDFETLRDLYGKAKIFWSASGFGQDEIKNPEKTEHFGITVVEAMAGGVVPVVYNAGGHKEIVKNGESGFLWTTVQELTNITSNLIGNPGKMKELSGCAKIRAKNYDNKIFEEKISAILK